MTMGGKPKPAHLDHATTARDGGAKMVQVQVSWHGRPIRMDCNLSKRRGGGYMVDLATPTTPLPPCHVEAHRGHFREAITNALKRALDEDVSVVPPSRVDWGDE